MPRNSLNGKVIIITGASAGIGAATARACATVGMDIVICARRAERLRELATSIEAMGRQAVMVTADVADDQTSERLLDAARVELGGFDAVFANAGYGLDLPIHKMDHTQLRSIFDVNFFAATDLIQRAARRLLADGRAGHLLMCSSCLAKMSLPGHGAYCATKAAQNQVCRAMRMELRETGIKVSSVHPVTTRTELFEVSRARSGRPEGSKTVLDKTPGIFVQPPERVARAVVKCLHRSRSEVWTSMPTRLMAATGVAFPGLLDLAVRLPLVKGILDRSGVGDQ